jgi:hypothetical protein
VFARNCQEDGQFVAPGATWRVGVGASAACALLLCACMAMLPSCGLGLIRGRGLDWLVGAGGAWWLTWLGIPVSILGTALYGAILILLPWTRAKVSKPAQGLAWRLLTLLALLAGGTSLWLLGLELLAAAEPCPARELVQWAGLAVSAAVLIRGPLRLRRRRMPPPDPIKIRRFAAGLLGFVALLLVLAFVLGQVALNPREIPAAPVDPAAPGADVPGADASAQPGATDGGALSAAARP